MLFRLGIRFLKYRVIIMEGGIVFFVGVEGRLKFGLEEFMFKF